MAVAACEPRIEASVTYEHPTALVFEITLPRTAKSVHLLYQVPLRTTMSPTWRVTSTPLGTSISSARSYDWRTWNSWTYTSKNSRSLWYAVTTRSWNQNTWVPDTLLRCSGIGPSMGKRASAWKYILVIGRAVSSAKILRQLKMSSIVAIVAEFYQPFKKFII